MFSGGAKRQIVRNWQVTGWLAGKQAAHDGPFVSPITASSSIGATSLQKMTRFIVISWKEVNFQVQNLVPFSCESEEGNKKKGRCEVFRVSEFHQKKEFSNPPTEWSFLIKSKTTTISCHSTSHEIRSHKYKKSNASEPVPTSLFPSYI